MTVGSLQFQGSTGGPLGVPGLNFNKFGQSSAGSMQPRPELALGVGASPMQPNQGLGGGLGVPGLNFTPLSDAQYKAQYGHIGKQPAPAPAPAPVPAAPDLSPQEQIQKKKDERLAYMMKHENAYWGGNR